MEEAITYPISSKNIIDVVNKTEKSQTSKKNDTINSIYKYSSTHRSSLSNRSTRIEKPTEIDIFEENKNISDFYGQGDDLPGITPDILRIPRKNKRKKPQALILL